MAPAGTRPSPGGGATTRGGRPASGRSTTPAIATATAVLVLFLLAVTLASTGAEATVPGGSFNATENDTEAPTVGNLTKVDFMTVELEIEDDTDVDEDSIDAADLFVSEGTIANVTATENGTNATITIDLEARLDTDELGVAVADSATIYDEADNQLDSSGDVWRYVTGMDGVAPSVTRYAVDNGSGETVRVSVRTTETLASLYVKLYGPETIVLDRSDFEKPSGISEYEAAVSPPADGEYRVTLLNVTDEYDNTRDTTHYDVVRIDSSPPDAVAGIDFGASSGLALTFDATRSADDGEIRTFTWDFGDGTNATGERVTHRFEPGNYTVTLSATDAFGNVGTDDLVLNLSDGTAPANSTGRALGRTRVSIGNGGETGGTATMVDVTDARAGEPVRIARDGATAPIAAADAVSLEALTVTLERNASFGLGIQAEKPDDVADVTGATDGRPLGGLTILHDVADDDVANVTFDVGVDRESVDELVDDPDAVRLFRYHDGAWHELDTGRDNGTNATYRYRASSPGLSRFAIATVPGAVDDGDSNGQTATADEQGEAADEGESASPVSVTDASLNATDVDPGQAVRVSATIEHAGDDPAGFTAGLTVDGQVVETQSLAVPPGQTMTIDFTYVPASAGSYDVAVNGTAAGTISAGDGGGLLAGLLGFLPLGLLEALVTYLGGLLMAVYLLLKAIALYLGY